ncbi:hypothetical protein ANCCAN_20102 [Ancylostoma caninum]|uniref:ShKT domain-containing protein n=1 Tax=Ancylostoma caninum TaxID=29170 RepID=A0A368FPA8_ANCCA|nr:hypothetical protein ANCCAN_20102 [Ancylostoma caninum]
MLIHLLTIALIVHAFIQDAVLADTEICEDRVTPDVCQRMKDEKKCSREFAKKNCAQTCDLCRE